MSDGGKVGPRVRPRYLVEVDWGASTSLLVYSNCACGPQDSG